MFKNLFYKLKQGTEYLNYGRNIILTYASEYISKFDMNEIRILDIGLGNGTDLLNIKKNLPDKKFQLFGLDYSKQYLKRAGQNNINIYFLNIEKEIFPFKNEYFDIVIINQVIEHTKEIFWIFSEISRVLKKQGIAVIGLPNLASFHNRIALLLGQQPTSIELLGPHVRGFTVPCFKRFIEADGYFKVLDIKGANFYPFPPLISKVLSRILPSFSVSLFFLIKRTNKKGKFINILNSRHYETLYFKGK